MSNYTVNAQAMATVFCLPAAVADRHIKLATPTQLRVIIYLFRHLSENTANEEITAALGISAEEADDALSYWAAAGILCKAGEPTKELADQKPKNARISTVRPTREEIAKRGNEDEKLQFLFREVQMKFGRPLRQNETAVLVWLYDDEGMDISVILTLVEYAVRQNKTSVRFLETTAVKWISAGVETLADADAFIGQEARDELSWKIVAAAFGIRDRKPSKQEKELAVRWVEEYGYDRVLLEKAYDACIDGSGGYSIPYLKKIIDRWHSDGVKTVDDVKEPKKKKPKGKSTGDYAAYDLALAKKLLDDGED